ncbi:MAG: DNA ligase D [Gemmatimonadetes bacterium]|nr:DNA ligase D [Gemmatimonadota bacterium]
MTADALAEYRAKRTAARTPEPFGGQVVAGGSVFVAQLHAATALHWDLRLEHEGVLLSWAVPKGPSPNQADKRLALRTEDHPLEYAEFEGLIPEGEYGAGPMIVWDRGFWTPEGSVADGLDQGKLLFALHGHKLHGMWTLVKTRQAPNSWLLIKERDEHLRPDGGTDDYPEDSIYSGLRVGELAHAERKANEIAAEATKAGARPGAVRAGRKPPMLAFADAPFSGDGWIFEVKYDGYRLVAERTGGEPYLRSRTGADITRTFPEIARAVRGLPYSLTLDGEVVVNGADGLPSFAAIQRRGKVTNATDALIAGTESPALYYAFDLLSFEGLDLRPLPLVERKRLLKALLPSVGPVRYVDHIEREGEAMFAHAEAMGLEGIVGKRSGSAYRSGRSRAWVKVRVSRVGHFVIVGWTDPGGSRTGFGALHLAGVEDEKYVYRGSVGSGFSEAALREISEALRSIGVAATPCSEGDPPAGKSHHWVEPSLGAEVEFRELSPAGHLRLPVFKRLLTDREVGAPAGLEPNAVAEERIVPFTNLDKVFWPEEGYTKGDLVEYHRRIAPWMLPYLRRRPLVMTRYPDGITGKSFYQKDAPKYAPTWFRRLKVWSDSSGRELSYFVADDLDSLLYVINLGTIPLHVWSSRVGTLPNPDWCVLDLDPKGAPFADVVVVAGAIRELCDDIGLPVFVKTSGSTGIHVLIPLAPGMTYEQSRFLGELLAKLVVADLPELATVERALDRREGKVYVDFLQNRRGSLIAAPFTVRPLPGAPVSAPLRWDEVVPGLAMKDHDMASVVERMEADGDPLAPVLTAIPDIADALGKLEKRLSG